MRVRYLAIAIGITALSTRPVVAQTLRGVVTDAGTTPVPGVVMILVDAGAKEVARAYTNERGEYRLVAPRAGDYRLRTLRIGFRPQTTDAISLGAGAVVDRPVALASVPTGLDTLRAVGRSTCNLTERDSVAATWKVWEQVRAALTVTQLTRGNRGISATTVSFNKTLEPVRRQLQQQEFDVRSDFVSQPWRAATPAELHRVGYVIESSSGTTYQAPSIDALLADEFLGDHCVRLVTSRDPSLIGVAFEPNRERRDIPDIKGTIWVDRTTSELRSLEYRYANASKDAEGFGGGEMEFVRMKNGAWAISSWNIRMPSLAMKENARPGDLPSIEAIRVVGGELALVTIPADKGRDTLYARPPLVLRGTVIDSAGAPVRGGSLELAGTPLRASTDSAGRFAFANVLPGIYTMKVRAGTDTTPLVETSFKFADSTAVMRIRVPRRSASTQVVASVGSAQAQGLATFTGTVVADSTNKGIQDAEVALPGLGLTTRANDRGEFTLAGIIPGTHQVVIRRVGYGPLDTRLTFAERETVDRRIVLSKLTVLDSVVTTGSPDNDPLMLSFEENRKRGFGVFITRAQLERFESMSMANVSQQITGLRLLRGRQNQTYVLGSRGPMSQCRLEPYPPDVACLERERLLYVPDPGEMQQGVQVACYAEVWMDRTLMNRGTPTRPFDLHEIAVSQIEALEWYSGSSQVPPQYQTMGSRCGVLVLHTRRRK